MPDDTVRTRAHSGAKPPALRQPAPVSESIEDSLAGELSLRRALLEGSRDGIVFLTLEGAVFEANAAFASMLGYTVNELKNLHVWDWDVLRTREELLERLRTSTSVGLTFETIHRRKDGVRIDVEVSRNRVEFGRQSLLCCIHREITERKRAEKVMADEVALRRILVQESRDGVAILRMDGSLYEANPAFAAMLGYSLEELMRLRLWDWDRQWNREELLERLHFIYSEGSTFETIHCRKDGTFITVEVSANSVVAGGQVLLCCIHRDITARKRAEAAAAADTALRRSLFELSRDGIVVLNLDGSIYDVNRAFAHMLGYTMEEMRQLHVWDWDTQWSREELLVLLDKLLVISNLTETVHRRKNGTTFVVEIASNAVMIGGMSFIFCVHRDITARKQAEAALAREVLLRRTFFEQSREGIVVLTLDGAVYQLNPAFAGMLGYTAEEVRQMRVWEWDARHDPGNLRRALQEISRGGRTGERVHERKDGTLIDVEITSNPVIFEGETLIFCTHRDITERKRSENALRESEHRYHSLFENMLDAFVYCRIVTDSEGRPVDWVHLEVNHAFERITGLKNAVGKRITELLPDVWERAPLFMEGHIKVAMGGPPERFEVALPPLGQFFSISVYSFSPGTFVAVFDDITERKQMEEERETAVQLLRVLNTGDDGHDLMRTMIPFLKNWSGCEAVGIRLQSGDDFPYVEVSGFSEEFVRSENLLCTYNRRGEAQREDSHTLLQCMCGVVLQGTTDPAKAYFTEHGSFWTNSLSELRATLPQEERQYWTRNRCLSEGFESVAILPLRHESATFGLIQLNDRDTGRFTPARIGLLERLAESIAKAQRERLIRAALRESEERFSQIALQSREMIWEMDRNGLITYVSPISEAILGYAPSELVGKKYFHELYAEEDAGTFKRTILDIVSQGATFHNRVESAATKDGRKVWFSVSGGPILSETGEVIGYRGSNSDITERKRAEEEVLKSQQQLQAIADSVPGAIFQFFATPSGEWGLSYLSESAKRIFGIEGPTEEALSVFIRNMPPETAQRFEESIAEAVKNLTRWEFQGEINKPTGETIAFEGVAVPVPADDLVLYSGVMLDVTGRKRAEEELQKRQRQIQDIADSIPGALFQFYARPDGELGLSYVSESAKRIFGIDAPTQDALRVFSERLLPETSPRFAESILKAVSEVSRWEFQGELMLPSGEVVSFDAVSIPVPSDEMLLFNGVMLDSTSRRAAERSLHREREFGRALLEKISDGVAACDSDGRLVLLNRTARDWHGSSLLMLPLEEWSTRESLYEADGVTPLPAASNPLVRAFAGEDVRNASMVIHVEGQPPRYIVADGGPFYDERFNRLGAVVAMHDVTERKEAEEERERLEAQLRQAQKMEAVGQLAGGIAHDFNNLLQVILGHLELVQNDMGPEFPSHQEIEEARTAGEKAAELTRQLLAFSRRQVIQPVNLDLNELVHGLLKMIGRLIGEDIELRFVSGRRLGVVHVDKGQIEQVLMNLCVNARDAMPKGGTLIIETENVTIGDEYCRAHPWATEGRYVLLSVTDTGHGMDALTRSQIFEPFFTTKGIGKGTGLGLATAYGIVRQHNGLIHVYSEPGMGTAFKIYLPIVDRPAQSVGPKLEARVEGGTEVVLVAEDEEKVRELVIRILREAGYTVLAARDGEEALRLVEEHSSSIALAILDVMMPKLGGRDVMERVQHKYPHIRFLFSSGYSENAIHTNFVIKEGLNLISKPYRGSDLLRAVRRVLGG